MPILRIISDALSRVSIDGIDYGQIEPKVVGTYNLPIGDHVISLVSPYNKLLQLKRTVRTDYERTIELNLSSLFVKNKDVLLELELFRYERNGKTGFFEPITKTIVIEPVFDSCSLFNDSGYSYVNLKGKQGVINKKGDLIIPCEYSSINSYDKYFLVEKNKKYGILDKNGRIIFGMIPYEIHACYSDGGVLGWYYSDGKICTFLNRAGEEVIKGYYDSFNIQSDAGRRIIVAQGRGNNNDKYHIYNEYGRLIIDHYFDYYVRIEDGLIHVMEGDWSSKKEGLYDFDGRAILPVEYDEISSYSGGFFTLKKGGKLTTVRFDGSRINSWPYSICQKPAANYILFSDSDRSILYNTETNSKCTLQYKCDNVFFFPDEHGHENGNGYIMIGKNGKYGIVSPMPQCRLICDCIYDSVTGFVNGYACVEKNGRFGAIDTSGRLTIPCKYGTTFFFSKDGYANVFNYQKNNCGYIIPNDIIDINDNSVLGFHPYVHINWSHDSTRSTQSVISANTRDFKYCLIDFYGKLLGQYDYSTTTPWSESLNGFFVANKCNGVTKRGWVNKYGKEIIPCKFDCVSYADTHLLWCNINSKNALFSDEGKQLTDFVYEDVEAFHNGYAIVKKASGYGILSSSGKEVTGFLNESVDQFFVGHQLGDYDVYDAYTDEDGYEHTDLVAVYEGPFRYGIASLKTDKRSDSQILIDVNGNMIKLRSLDECTLN